MQNVRLYISVPSNRDPKRLFCSSFAGLTQHLKSPGLTTEGYYLQDFFYGLLGNSSCLPMARQAFVDDMIRGGYTHWLSLDDDMTFPYDIVDRLIKHGKDVVSCNARLKTPDTDKVIGSCLAMNGRSLDSTGRTGLEEIKTMGGAIFLAKIDAFKNIPRPHFQVMWSENHKDYIGEDVFFSALLRTNGIKLYCDHDASQHIGHVGEYVYKFPAMLPRPQLQPLTMEQLQALYRTA